MVYCVVKFCKKRSETSSITKDGISFHMFPKDPLVKKEWMKFCSRPAQWVPKRTSVICSRHFEPSCFEAPLNERRRLKGKAVPTIIFGSYCKIFNVPESIETDPLMISSVVSDSAPTSPSEPPSPKPEPQVSIQPPELPQTLSRPPIRLLDESLRNRKLQEHLKYKNVKIKRLQAQIRYLKQKVNNLEEHLNHSSV